MALYSVANGNPLRAADLNQYANLLNGTVAGQMALSGGSTTTVVPLTFVIPSGTTSGNIFTGGVTGDTGTARIFTYLTGGTFAVGFSDGVSGGSLGDLQAQSGGGWYVPQSFTASGNLTVNGTGSSLAGLAVGGAMTVTGNTTLSGGGAINIAAGHVAYSGSATVPVWPTSSGGTGVWWSDDGNNLVATTVKGTNNNGRDFCLGYLDNTNVVRQVLSAQYSGAVHFFSRINLATGSLGGINGFGYNANSTSQVVSHGLSTTPDTILICTGSTGVQGYATCSAGSYGTSTFISDVYQGAGALAAYCIAIGS